MRPPLPAVALRSSRGTPLSVIVFHPSVAPFVQQSARALHEAGWLDRFITTLRHDPESPSQRAACAVARAFGFDLCSQLRRRAVTDIPACRVESHPFGEIARLLSGRLERSGRLVDFVWERSETAFDRRVARALRAHHDAVYGFEHSSLATFESARRLGKKVFYETPAPETRFVRALLDDELARHPELKTPYQRHTALREDRRTARRHAEWEAADLVIAASRFTRNSFASAGFDVRKIRVIPYGAPDSAERDVALGAAPATTEPLALLWSGSFSPRKGAHHVIEAWRRGRLGRHVRLRVFGAQLLPERLLAPLPPGIELAGSIPRPELMFQYRGSDALLFPPLCDGFGMVATEAWSQGLPVITTERAGAADLLQPPRNGLLIRAADPEAIIEVVTWCLDHRGELRAMREAAWETAAAWQWCDYRAALRAALAPVLAGGTG
jgi:glycosyltransferase involved in cell wall biosynthesis